MLKRALVLVIIIFFINSIYAQNKYLCMVGPEYSFLGKHYSVIPLQNNRFIQGLGYSLSIQRLILNTSRYSLSVGLSHRLCKQNFIDTVNFQSQCFSNLTVTDRTFNRTKISTGIISGYQYKVTKGLFINLTLATEIIFWRKYSEKFAYNDQSTMLTGFKSSRRELVFPFSIGLAKQIYKNKKVSILLEPYYSNELFFYRYL